MATDIRELQGLRALVTGGTKGIGHAIAGRLNESGATVLTTARTAPDDSSGVDFVAADVATADGCRTVVEAVNRRFGGRCHRTRRRWIGRSGGRLRGAGRSRMAAR